MQLNPKEAIVLFIRRSDSEPATYMVGMRKAESEFALGTHDLRIGGMQEALSAMGKFHSLEEAIVAGARGLEQLISKAAFG